ncbi:MAG: SMP-30/gluconolactonase/LRE family protein [Blastocatellia bacterium]|nr:SMP-30/gluconolactonase/LRE family protein [Blastocatellia bacterium]
MKTKTLYLLLGALALANLFECGAALAAPGDLYVAENGMVVGNSIVRFTPEGVRSTFAGGFITPTGLAFDRSNNLYVSDGGTGTIFKFTPAAEQTVFASGLSGPSGLAFDSGGNLFAAEPGSGSIVRFSPDGTKSTFASGLNAPNQLAFDTSGNLYVSETVSGTISKFASDGTKTTFASGLSSPSGIAFDQAGNLYAAESASGTIFKFTTDGTKTTFASGLGFVGALAFDNEGQLFAGTFDRILKFAPDGSSTTFGGTIISGPFAFEPGTEKLRNISARALVGTGDDALIGGFILGGNALANNGVVVRAIGPSLSQSGVTNPLADPTLELRDASGALIASNDDWQDDQETEITATGLAPTDPNESAIYGTLPAGNYTAVVRGAGDTIGVALVEVYSVGQ